MAADKKEQIKIAERLQLALLKRFEKQLEDGSITSTDAATLTRLLSQNGWTLDETRIPQGLKGKLTQGLSAADFDQDDGKVVSIQNARKA